VHLEVELPLQALAPPSLVQASAGQVSWPSSPGCGMVWKIQAIFPVRTS
jgi:hypothetical protein